MKLKINPKFKNYNKKGKVKIMENQNVNVNENKGELTLFSGIKQNVYCSKVAETETEKKELFNALESCDALLNDCVGQEIDIKDIYVEEKQVADSETGEIKTKYRTILFDVNGQTYATGSYGIYNILKKIVQIYGLPENWEKPLKVKVAKRPIGNGKQSLTLTLM